MCCATLLPAICSTTGPICAACSRCSAMPISRRRRSIPTCKTNGCAGWSKRLTRWPNAVSVTGMRHFLDFERPIAELEGKIEELRHLSSENGLNIADEVGRLAGQADRILRQTYGK